MTRNRLLEELGLDIDPKAQQIIQGITKESVVTFKEEVESFTFSIFGDIVDSNKNFIQVLDEELTKVELHSSYSTKRTVGMAIVLRAFDINCGFDLLQRFGNLQEEDLVSVRRILQEILTPKGEGLSIIKRLLRIPRIPEQQIDLNEIVGNVIKRDSYSSAEITEGACAMYQILGRLWTRLYPSNQTFPPQPPSTV